MRKCVVLFAFILIVSGILVGCETKQESPQNIVSSTAASDELPTIRLLVDFISDGIGDSILDYVQRVPGYGTDFKVDYTYLPRKGAERESQLTSIRTEILAGKGPDIFICSCPNFDYDTSKPLFLFPDQVMEQRVFCPLTVILRMHNIWNGINYFSRSWRLERTKRDSSCCQCRIKLRQCCSTQHSIPAQKNSP